MTSRSTAIVVLLVATCSASQAAGSRVPRLSEPMRRMLISAFQHPGAAPGDWGCPISLGFEASGVHLDLVDALPVPDLPPWRTMRIRLCRGGRMVTQDLPGSHSRYFVGGTCAGLTKFNQLRGLVRIVDEQDALRFVRLRTSPLTYYAWGPGRLEVEIVPQSEASSLPDFGLAAGKDIALYRMSMGQLGVMFDAEYRDSGFEPAKVKRVRRGFEVTRWINWISPRAGQNDASAKRGVQRIREFVGWDGEYRRSVTGGASVHKLPDLPISLS